MDVSLIRAIPTPVNLGKVHGYIKAVKDAHLLVEGASAELSEQGQRLLAECCADEGLPSPVPLFLALHAASESATFLLKPVMRRDPFTIPATLSDGRVQVDLGQILTALQIEPSESTRIRIPISAVVIEGWGSALVLHVGALDGAPAN